MSVRKIRGMVKGGASREDIAEENYLRTGYRPHRNTVGRKLAELGISIRASHEDLLPWNVRKEHHDSWLRRYLTAESRRRKGLQLSPGEESEVKILHDLLFGGRGRQLVVAYHPEVGFYLTERLETDEDIIRLPDAQETPVRADKRM